MSQYFKYDTDPKLACPCCGEKGMNNGFMLILDEIRREVKQPLVINSGYRCSAENQRVSSTGEYGPHTTGRAVDFKCDNSHLRIKLIKAATKLQLTRIGIAKSFVHVDNLNAEDDNFPSNVAWLY